MELTLEQVKSIINGAVRIELIGDVVGFYRFAAEQQALYRGITDCF